MISLYQHLNLWLLRNILMENDCLTKKMWQTFWQSDVALIKWIFEVKKYFTARVREKCEGKGGGSRNGVLFHNRCSRVGFKTLLVYQNPLLSADSISSIPPARNPFFPTVVHENEIAIERSRRWLTESIEFAGSIFRLEINLGFRVSIGNHSFLDSNAFLGFRVFIGN